MQGPHGPGSEDTVLYLDGQRAYDHLRSFDVLQRSDERTVIWRDRNHAISLRHIIPEGAVPYTFHSSHCQYHPEDHNAVTFVDEDGRSNHRFLFPRAEDAPAQHQYPYYRFPNNQTSLEFQRKVFDKKLLWTYDVETISRNTTTNWLLAQRQQLKLWRKNQIPYITFFVHLATGHRNQCYEFDIRWFKATAQLQDSKTVVVTFFKKHERRKTDSHSEQNRERRSTVTERVLQALTSRSANADAIRDPTPELEHEELSFPRSLNLHDKEPERPPDHLLNWVWLKIKFTNDGDAETFVDTCLRAAEWHRASQAPTPSPPVWKEIGSQTYFPSGTNSSETSGHNETRAPSTHISPTHVADRNSIVTSAESRVSTSLPSPTSDPTPRRISDAHDQTDEPKNSAAEEWWRQFLYHRIKLFPSGSNYGVRAVKVAVLDTGIDTTNPYIYKHWLDNGDVSPHTPYRDFMQEHDAAARLSIDFHSYNEDVKEILGTLRNRGPDQPEDLSGHGTYVAGILLQLVPDARLYIARVLERDREIYSVGDAARRVALAVLLATHVWKVQIISVSIGFDWDLLQAQEKKIVQLSLDYAKTRGVVIFAAASNHGNRARIAFPASQRHYVICVNSSNGSGHSSDFNPPSQAQHDNFSILGESVSSTWLQNSPPGSVNFLAEGGAFKRQSGTSIATPIAASAAALVMQFGLHYLNVSNNEKIQSFDGISRILCKMAEHETREGFFDIVPWKVLNSNRGEESIKRVIEAEMENV